MVKHFGIAPLYLGQRSLGQRGLDSQHSLGFAGSRAWPISEQFENLLDMGHVGLAKFDGFASVLR